jgi:glyoxylase-like metal-dependent hydrolase (beta-lactamase superfamily II)
MKFGEFEIAVVSGGRMWFDGGTVFGVVPKVLWAQQCSADERNMVQLDTNCLVVRGRGGVGLVETGYGVKAPARVREHYGLDSGNTLLDNLSRLNIQPSDVNWVTFTHLHFDHAGGCTLREDGKLRPTFPRARHYIQRPEWEDANADLLELAGTYYQDDFVPLADAGLIELIDDEAEPVPGVRLRLDGGHTRGHQVVCLRSNAQTAVYLGDLCPTPAHLKAFWSTAFDQFPRTVRRNKKEIFDQAIDQRWLVIFGHDVNTKAAYLTRDRKGNPTVLETVEL